MEGVVAMDGVGMGCTVGLASGVVVRFVQGGRPRAGDESLAPGRGRAS